jgi:hypothetical protein
MDPERKDQYIRHTTYLEINKKASIETTLSNLCTTPETTQALWYY